ncbi:MAG: c-type cytochrome [Bernardetiaceae bacterium]|nr:c-type cytochrome [Bernardetiaceae bacterium]
MNKLLIICALCGGLLACAPERKPARALAPALQKALADFEVADGLEIELFAAEPLVADPVAMEVDENGLVYVVEMHGYPLDKSGTGRVKILTDTDADGYPDQATVFADSLVLPTGIMRWKNGVIVTDPPHVWYLEDQNGDHRADLKRILLTGFALSNPQHNVNTPLFGLDNWIYLAHESSITPSVYQEEFGDKGREVHFPDRPEVRLPQNANGRNVRFKPASYELEMCAGETQFGQTFDPFGRHILNSNGHHLFHEVIADRYLRRNPDLLVADATQSLPDHGDACEVYPITQNPEHQLLTDVGVITSACGVTWYTGGLFPEKYQNLTVVAEPVHNLVHADFVRDSATSFVASRVWANREFLASKDPWFRPVNFYIGPEGALYVIDYYRQIVEHPEWMAEDVGKSGKLYNGTDQGRIYRLKPKGQPLPTIAQLATLGKADGERLVKALASPNLWFRRQAQRLLLHRADLTIIPLLEKTIRDNPSPEAVVHALWTWHGLSPQVKEEIFLLALQNTHPGVRENAIKILENAYGLAGKTEAEKAEQPRLPPAVLARLLALQNDPSAKVRFQLLCTLGYLDNAPSLAARSALLVRDIEDPWVHYAALSAAQGQELALLDFAVQQLATQPTEGRGRFFAHVAGLIGLGGNAQKINALFTKIGQNRPASQAWWQAACLAGLAQALPHAPELASADLYQVKSQLINYLANENPPILRQASLQLLAVVGLPPSAELKPAVAQALQRLTNPGTPEDLRIEALQLLGLAQPDQHVSHFERALAPHEPLPVQKAALQALDRTEGAQACRFLLQQWTNFTAEIRHEAISLFFKNPARTRALLAALEKQQVSPQAINWPDQVRLLNHHDLALRQRARVVLANPEMNKAEILAKYKTALATPGDAVNGAKVYQTYCTQCHQMNGTLGKAIGPDLGTLKNRQPLSIALEVLAPGNSIADGYEYWTVEKTNGEKTAGLLSEETATALTLKDLAGRTTVIPRREVAKLTAATASVMPNGFASTIGPAAMADLVTFIKTFRQSEPPQ